MCPNVADFPRAYYGILAAGAVVVPVHLLLTVDEVAYVLRDSSATVLVCHSSQLEVGAKAAAAAGIPVVTMGPLPPEIASGVHPDGDAPRDLRRRYRPMSRGRPRTPR